MSVFCCWIPVSSWTQIAFPLKTLFSEDKRRVCGCKDERRTWEDKYVPLLRQHVSVWELVMFLKKPEFSFIIHRSPLNSSILPSWVTHKICCGINYDLRISHDSFNTFINDIFNMPYDFSFLFVLFVCIATLWPFGGVRYTKHKRKSFWENNQNIYLFFLVG